MLRLLFTMHGARDAHAGSAEATPLFARAREPKLGQKIAVAVGKLGIDFPRRYDVVVSALPLLAQAPLRWRDGSAAGIVTTEGSDHDLVWAAMLPAGGLRGRARARARRGSNGRPLISQIRLFIHTRSHDTYIFLHALSTRLHTKRRDQNTASASLHVLCGKDSSETIYVTPRISHPTATYTFTIRCCCVLEPKGDWYLLGERRADDAALVCVRCSVVGGITVTVTVTLHDKSNENVFVPIGYI